MSFPHICYYVHELFSVLAHVERFGWALNPTLNQKKQSWMGFPEHVISENGYWRACTLGGMPATCQNPPGCQDPPYLRLCGGGVMPKHMINALLMHGECVLNAWATRDSCMMNVH